MKIKFNKDFKFSPNGYQVQTFLKGTLVETDNQRLIDLVGKDENIGEIIKENKKVKNNNEYRNIRNKHSA